MSQLEALVTPSVMKWARERAHLSLDDAAARIKRPVSDIENWENGIVRPSIAQARKASEVYKRPLAVFYLPEPPTDFETLRDFRSLADTTLSEYSPELALVVRQARYRQEWTREFIVSEGAEKLSFVGSASLRDSPATVADKIMKVLQITSKEQQECLTREEALRLWVQKTEEAGVFLFRQGHVDLSEARGFVLSDDYAPFVFINSEDAKAAQMFTLLHELAHLWINVDGLSNLEPFTSNTKRDVQEMEVFCNKVAAHALLNPSSFDDAWSR